MPKQKKFDVFICYNSKDRDEVIKIAEDLKKLGLNPWIDIWNLRPGFPWLPELGNQIENIKAVAVFIGQNGIGPWQTKEIVNALTKVKQYQYPIIPVILEKCEDISKENLPPFLFDNHWVDYRVSNPDPMVMLHYGITGKKKTNNDRQPFHKEQFTEDESFGRVNHEVIDKGKSKYVFIIHGRNEARRLELKDLLHYFHIQSIVLQDNVGKGCQTLIDKFEYYANQCDFAFAIFTSDDNVKNNGEEYLQACPNICFEIGWFYAKLGKGKICILYQQDADSRLLSDLQGVSRLEFKSNIREVGIDIEKVLHAAGLIS